MYIILHRQICLEDVFPEEVLLVQRALLAHARFDQRQQIAPMGGWSQLVLTGEQPVSPQPHQRRCQTFAFGLIDEKVA